MWCPVWDSGLCMYLSVTEQDDAACISWLGSSTTRKLGLFLLWAENLFIVNGRFELCAHVVIKPLPSFKQIWCSMNCWCSFDFDGEHSICWLLLPRLPWAQKQRTGGSLPALILRGQIIIELNWIGVLYWTFLVKLVFLHLKFSYHDAFVVVPPCCLFQFLCIRVILS